MKGGDQSDVVLETRKAVMCAVPHIEAQSLRMQAAAHVDKSFLPERVRFGRRHEDASFSGSDPKTPACAAFKKIKYS